MCGICGIIDQNQTLSQEKRDFFVKEMNASIRHRGPDETGYLSDGNFTLAMSRLAIIDLKSGQQPIYNQRKNIGIFFNGEIYNFLDLKKDLLAKGHQFQTNSDTEVIVHLYEEYGEAMPAMLKGMFAFCIFDKDRQRFFFARDRFGEKPFYYHLKDGMFSFSSEVKSLLDNQAIPRKLNREALDYYLKVSMVPEPITMLQDVFILPPGHSLTLKNGVVDIQPFFKVDYQPDPTIKTEEAAAEFVKPYLEKAVERQMVSDVPLGAFLSGGIDSSTIVALLQKQSAKKLKTFTVKFEHTPYDESPIAREVAEKVGTDHHEITIPNENFDENLFWMIIDHVGLPFNDSSCIPSYLITKEIRKHVTVALSGDGGDELFAGYDLFQWWKKIHHLKRIPSFVRSISANSIALASKMPLLNSLGLLRQAHKAFDFSLEKSEKIPLRIHEMLPDAELKKLFKQSVSPREYALYTAFFAEAKDWSSIRTIMYYRLKYNLPINMLVKVDRMSMANSLEVRAPFLDPDLFEASTKIPDQFLIKNGKGKYLIRKMMEKELPKSVFDHPKTGFSIPLHKYQNAAYEKLADSLFTEENPLSEIFSLEYLQELKRVGLAGKDTANTSTYRSSHRLWAMMLLFGWVKRFKISL